MDLIFNKLKSQTKISPINAENQSVAENQAFTQRENSQFICSPNFSIQPKLTIGSPNDPYEHEADAVANQVMRMPETNFVAQRKCTDCEKDEKVQRKPLASFIQRKESSGGTVASDSVSSQINASRGSGGNMDTHTLSFMQSRFGADFSDVKIHTSGEAIQMNRELNAKAFTVGNDIYFNEGQYSPGSNEGKHLLAHELTHTVQQGGNNVIQRYLEASGTAGAAIGKSYRFSDDLTTAVKVKYPNHDLYAEAGKVAISNAKLAAVGSGIKLVEESSTFNISQGSVVKTLTKVTPKNTKNLTSGDSMKIADDCGTACSIVVGSSDRSAIHRDAFSGLISKTSATNPSMMKAEIMKKLLLKWYISSSTSATSKTKILDVIAKTNAKQIEIDTARIALNAAITEADKEAKGEIYWQKVDEYGEIMMSYYNVMPETWREEVDKYLGINKYANPEVGQGYTMSTGGATLGPDTWNFHWGGVVMKSNDQQDTITLENYALDGKENQDWEFAMYGTASKKGQTFHEEHQATKQHGDRPTTMKIEKN